MRNTPERPAIIVIFGITGDLAQRKLLPALYHLFKDNLLDEKTVIVGITRRDISADELLGEIDRNITETFRYCDPIALGKVRAALRMHKMSQTDPAEYRDLYTLLNGIEDEYGMCMNRLYYLSIPPQMFEPIVRNLGEQGLNKSCHHDNAETRLLVEKPFGYDLHSAHDLIEETAKQFREEQLFRIDHYLAKDTVQQIIDFRQMTPKLQEIWNSTYISEIVITAYEKIGIEGRAMFYEGIGALRDFIQSHLSQLLAVVAMELPEGRDSDAVHATRLDMLQSLEPINATHVASQTLRGQYEGYRDEVGNPDSFTETFARVRLTSNLPRWEGTRFVLQTGKAMADKCTDVSIMFNSSEHGQGRLVFSIQPDLGIRLESVGAGEPSWFAELRPAVHEFNDSHVTSSNGHPDAYERVLVDAVRGDHTLFTTSDEVLAAWRTVNDVVNIWSRGGEGLIMYQKGAADVQA